MPLYRTLYKSNEVGVYSGQRPSVAACKAFTQLRKKDPIKEACIEVYSVSRKSSTNFDVVYKQVDDDLLGSIYRPFATKSGSTKRDNHDLKPNSSDIMEAAAAAAAAAETSSGLACQLVACQLGACQLGAEAGPEAGPNAPEAGPKDAP